MNPHTSVVETSDGGELAAHTRRAFDRALVGDSKLDSDVLSMRGMSGRRYRMFVNALIEHLPAPRYLEIGSWAGSTLCSAISGNEVDAMAIDNWSQFGGPATEFFTHLARHKGAASVSFLERDFRQVHYDGLGPFNVYMFDGPHEFHDQYDGITLVQPALAPRYIQVVDDWNMPSVRGGTMKAIADLGLRVDMMVEIRTSLNDQHAPPPHGEHSDWHNGYFFAVLSRPV